MKASLNIWSIEKDSSIKLFLLLIAERFGYGNLVISEKDNLDSRSVRLCKTNDEEISAYIYTYGQPQGKYGLHLEFPVFDDSDILNSMDIYDGISFNRVIELLSIHFDVT